AVMRLGHHVDDLVEGAANEVYELEFGHRPHARKRCAKSRAYDGRFGNRSINHALRAKVVDESISDFERAAIDANVFANTEHGGISFHLLPQSLPDCLKISCCCHIRFFSAIHDQPGQITLIKAE